MPAGSLSTGSRRTWPNVRQHPYTHGLVSAVPDHLVPRRLRGIPGVARGVGSWGNACAFGPRCSQRVSRCDHAIPELEPVSDGHEVRCFEWQRTPSLRLEPPLSDELDSARAPSALLKVTGLTATHRTRRQLVVAAEQSLVPGCPGRMRRTRRRIRQRQDDHRAVCRGLARAGCGRDRIRRFAACATSCTPFD